MATTTIHAPPAVQSHIIHVPQPAPADHPAQRFRSVFLGLGITLIVFGVLSFILGGVSFVPAVMGSYTGYIASGMWGGAWYIASGALATATGVRANRCNVVAGLIVSILTSLVAFGVGVAEAVIAGACQASNTYGYYYYYYYCPTSYQGIHGVLSFLAFLACILAIVHSSYCCCGGVCGGGQSNLQPTVVSSTTTVATVQQPMHIPMQQPYVQTAGQYYPQMQQAPMPVNVQHAAPQAQPAHVLPPAYSTGQKQY